MKMASRVLLLPGSVSNPGNLELGIRWHSRTSSVITRHTSPSRRPSCCPNLRIPVPMPGARLQATCTAGGRSCRRQRRGASSFLDFGQDIVLSLRHGIGGGFIRTLLQVYLSTNYKKHLGMAHGLMFAGATASSFVFPSVLMSLKEAVNARGCMLILGAILLHYIPLCMLIKHQDRVDISKNVSTNGNIETIETTEELTTTETSSRSCFVIARDAGKILCTPTFYIIVISWLLVVYALELFFITIVDFAIDRGLTADDAVTLLAGYAVTDLCGRVLLPVAADKQYVRTSTLMAVNYFFLASSFLALPEVWSFASLLVVGALAPIFMGCGLAMTGVLMAKYMGRERLPLSYAIASLLSSPLVFLKPVVIGYYRDYIGSYNDLYRLLGGLLLSLCIPWTVTTIWERRENKRRTFLQHVYTSCNNNELRVKSPSCCRDIFNS